MMEDNGKNFKQNEVIKMKNEGDFQVLVENYFKELDLDDNQRKDELSTLTEIDAIFEVSGKKYLSLQSYFEYILSQFAQHASLAKELKSLDDLLKYEFQTWVFLYGWTSLIGNISHLIANGHNLNGID